MSLAVISGISPGFPGLSQSSGQVAHVLLTRSPLTRRFARLACVKHAASVRPEPGSNSPLMLCDHRARRLGGYIHRAVPGGTVLCPDIDVDLVDRPSCHLKIHLVQGRTSRTGCRTLYPDGGWH